jgi:hypothetical protein
MPGLRGALSVRVSDGQTDRIVTHYCRGLKFTKVAPGGHMSSSFTMVLPRNTFNALGPEDRVYVYDERTGRPIWEGYLENPTPVDGPDGQQYDISAVGGMAMASDETRALIYITKDIGGWIATTGLSESASVETGEWVTNNALKRVRTGFGGGSVLATGTVARADCISFEGTDTEMGGYRIGGILSGKTDANYTLDIINANGTLVSGAMQTTSVSSSAFIAAGGQRLAFQLRRSGGATTVGDDTTWSDWVDWSAIGRRKDRYGTDLTGSGALVSTTQVLASQVVEDLLGRLLTMCDPGTAQIDVTTFGIDQLAWPDGVKAADVLSQLSLWESGYLWEILESLDSGKHRFNYRAWPTTSRYVVSVRDGFQQRGSDVDLCNRILVSWNDALGRPQVTPVTAASLGLTGIGLPVDALGSRVKDADPVTLPDGFGSSANATQIGGQILTDKINPPKAGSVVVRRPILDLLTGNTVMPWELEAGYLCRIRETGDDLRITQADYDDDTCSMLLTLGTPVLTTEQRLAKLSRPGALTLNAGF